MAVVEEENKGKQKLWDMRLIMEVWLVLDVAGVRAAGRGPKGKAVAKLLPTAIKRAAAYSVQTVFTSVDAVRLAILSVLSIFDCQSVLYNNC